jgi:DNA-binding response OmpR family regulator
MSEGKPDTRFGVLFVDDEEKARKYFQLAFGKEWPVLTAADVVQAMELLERRAESIGVLITDQRMPGQQGVDLLKRAREQWPGIVRLLTTAYADLEDAIAAVNRGEILRYITKPWDLEALRLELRHAMDFFLLRREHALLMEEKISVRQRLQAADRLRDLLVMAAGLQRLRHAEQAVAAWVLDRAAFGARQQPASAALELWGLAVAETLDLMGLHRRLRSLEQGIPEGFHERLALAQAAENQGLRVQGEGADPAVEVGLVRCLLQTLKGLAGKGPGRLDRVSLDGGLPAVRLTLELDRAALETLAASELDSDAGSGLIVAYLAAWHHGGRLNLARHGSAVRARLVLPLEPSAVTREAPDAEWVERRFAQLEVWEGR